jgi:hypothetical protein
MLQQPTRWVQTNTPNAVAAQCIHRLRDPCAMVPLPRTGRQPLFAAYRFVVSIP